MVQIAQSLTCTGLAMEGGDGGFCFGGVCWSPGGAFGVSLKEEGSQARACSVGHAVVLGKQARCGLSVAGVFAAFLAVSEQLP